MSPYSRGRLKRIRSAAVALTLLASLGLAGCAPTPSGLLNRLPDRSKKACVSNLHPTSSPDPGLAKAEAGAMPEDQFWALISVLHGANSDAAYKRLSNRLAALPTATIVAFDVRLTISLYKLDDQCRAHWYATHDPSGLGIVGDDDFLYFRADTVSAGRATWEKAIATDTLPWGTTDAVNNDGEDLLYVATDAAAKHHISQDKLLDMEAKVTDLSYETASNPAGWPPAK